MGLVPKPNFMRIHKVTQVFLIYHKPMWCWTIKTWFSSLSYQDGWAKLAISSSGIQGDESHAHTLFEFIKFSQALSGGKRRSQKFHPTFKIGSDTRGANEMLTLNLLEPIVVSLDYLKSKLPKAQLLLYLKNKLLLKILRSHQYGSNFQ